MYAARLSLLVACACLSGAAGNGASLVSLPRSRESRIAADEPAVLRAARVLRGGQQAAAVGIIHGDCSN